MARAGAAATALAGATAEAGYHVTAGVVKGVGKIAAHDIVGGVEHIVEGVAKVGSKVATAVSKAADPLDKARKGRKLRKRGSIVLAYMIRLLIKLELVCLAVIR